MIPEETLSQLKLESEKATNEKYDPDCKPSSSKTILEELEEDLRDLDVLFSHKPTNGTDVGMRLSSSCHFEMPAFTKANVSELSSKDELAEKLRVRHSSCSSPRGGLSCSISPVSCRILVKNYLVNNPLVSLVPLNKQEQDSGSSALAYAKSCIDYMYLNPDPRFSLQNLLIAFVTHGVCVSHLVPRLYSKRSSFLASLSTALKERLGIHLQFDSGASEDVKFKTQLCLFTSMNHDVRVSLEWFLRHLTQLMPRWMEFIAGRNAEKHAVIVHVFCRLLLDVANVSQMRSLVLNLLSIVLSDDCYVLNSGESTSTSPVDKNLDVTPAKFAFVNFCVNFLSDISVDEDCVLNICESLLYICSSTAILIREWLAYVSAWRIVAQEGYGNSNSQGKAVQEYMCELQVEHVCGIVDNLPVQQMVQNSICKLHKCLTLINHCLTSRLFNKASKQDLNDLHGLLKCCAKELPRKYHDVDLCSIDNVLFKLNKLVETKITQRSTEFA